MKKYKKVLILIDIEGEEFTLITSTLLEAARNCHFLIEMHDKSNGFHEKNLIELCKKTQIQQIQQAFLDTGR